MGQIHTIIILGVLGSGRVSSFMTKTALYIGSPFDLQIIAAFGLFICAFKTDRLHVTKVFAKAGRDNVTSTMCRHQQRFRLDVQFSALVVNFNIIFSNGHLYRAGRAMNSLPSQIPSVSSNTTKAPIIADNTNKT